jgi:hypothetical protein
LVSSNIKKYSHLQLLIEVLMRLNRMLKKEDKEFIGQQIEPYLKKGQINTFMG